jgi:hypothetical protein
MSDGLGNGEKRDGQGRWLPGSAAGPGRPKSLHRATLRGAITVADVKRAVKVLRKLMGSDDERIRLQAASEILDRSCGKPSSDDLVDRVERLETLLEQQNEP